jgi:hypothetical protein
MGFTRCLNSTRIFRCVAVADILSSQGSTRSEQRPTMPDTRLIWPLEENTKQKGGIPHEFTFVFLIHRPLPVITLSTESTGGLHATDTAKRSSGALGEVAAEPSKRRRGCGKRENKGKGRETATKTEEQGLARDVRPPALAHLADQAVASAPAEEKADERIAQRNAQGAMASVNPGSSSMEHAEKSVSETADQFKPQSSKSHGPDKEPPRSVADSSNTAIDPVPQGTSKKESSENPNNSKLVPENYSSIFGPIKINICVRPHIAVFEQYVDGGGILRHKEASLVINPRRTGFNIYDSDFKGDVAWEQVGEKFFDFNEKGVEAGGLYSFADLPGGLEDMVELSGELLTTMVCLNYSADLIGLELTLNRNRCRRLRQKLSDLLLRYNEC